MDISPSIQSMAVGGLERSGEPPPGNFFRNRGTILRQRYRIAAGCIGFQGHFEGNPVLPAMLQIMLARDCAERLRGGGLTIAEIAQAKFLSPVKPESTVTVHLSPPETEGADWLFQLFSQAKGEADEAEAARLKIRFADADS